MEICDICLYVCMYNFFYGTFTRVAMNNLDSMRWTAHFMWAGVALTNASNSSIAHTPWKKRKQIKEKAQTGKRRREREREARHNKKKRGKVGGKNNLKV